tara:strand:- start:747 stop:1289 length:543 start_codon:yes stop_codon:yes gene_type:complete
MKERIGNIWDYWQHELGEYGNKRNYIAVIPTNGVVKENGELMMGAGVARQAVTMVRRIPLVLGDFVTQYGNKSFCLPLMNERIPMATFPTKEHWRSPSTLERIEESATQLARWAKMNSSYIYLLPPPGCGLGKLLYKDVQPIIAPILPDNVWVMTRDGWTGALTRIINCSNGEMVGISNE